ncbi:hypothetical protein MPER_07035 [Moniliophthora perniciosa FA553]|nr:hypothetical protein MPER_07035 [Moniliophthora perniciosa FA553]
MKSDDDEDPKPKTSKGKEKASSKSKKDKGKDKEKTKKGAAKGKGKGGVQVPEDWPWEDAKKLFEKPDVTPADQVELEWNNPDIDGLVQFLVNEKGFNEERVRKGADNLQKFLNAKQQGRLDGFFTVKPKEKTEPAKKGAATKGGKDDKGKKGATSGAKRKGEDQDGGGKSKKAKSSGKK